MRHDRGSCIGALPFGDKAPFRELGPDWAACRFSVQHRTNRLVKQPEALGIKVTIEPDAA